MIGGVGKTGVIICDMCKMPCEKEVFFGGHGLIEEEEVIPLSLCSEECRDEHLEIKERIEAEVNKKVRIEFKLIHDSVCPPCVRRLKKLI